MEPSILSLLLPVVTISLPIRRTRRCQGDTSIVGEVVMSVFDRIHPEFIALCSKGAVILETV
jgi:hypothetical protein